MHYILEMIAVWMLSVGAAVGAITIATFASRDILKAKVENEKTFSQNMYWSDSSGKELFHISRDGQFILNPEVKMDEQGKDFLDWLEKSRKK